LERFVWLFVLPHAGQRTAELIEEPIMFVVIFFTARGTVRAFHLPSRMSARLPVGLVALALLIVAEVGVTTLVRGLTIRQYIRGRDPVAATVYALMLLVFAFMPVLVARSKKL
jgi:hypothetical protein